MRLDFVLRDRPLVLLAMVAGALPVAANAQCSTPWLATSSTPGVLGGLRTIYATAEWDRDGAGPLPPLVVVAGDFTIAGAVSANRIAAFDPATSTWSALGAGVSGLVRALLPMPNGDLVVAGNFASAGGIAASGIARFDGTTWWPLGTGVAGWVLSLARLPNGDLIAGGYFTTAGGVAANNIARWDGASWAPLGAGITGGDVRALTFLPNGDLVAGGYYTTAGGVAASNIARWDGATWSPLGLGLDSAVQALLVRSNGELVASGYFNYSGPSSGSPWLNHVARWNGTTWSPVGSGVGGSAWAIAELANGNLVIGSFQSQSSMQQWNGTAWLPMAPPGDVVSGVFALTTLANGDLVVGGEFLRLGGVGAGSVARWNGAVWSAMGSGLIGPVTQLLELADGSVVGIGGFAIGSSRNIARWNGSAWLPLGPGLERVTRVRQLANGNLLAAGVFPAGGGVVHHLAQWNGVSWSTSAPGLTGLNTDIIDVVELPNGNIVACGYFMQSLLMWNGVTWTSLGALTAQAPFVPIATALAVTATGELLVGGMFTGVGGVATNNIASWNGSVWSPLGSGLAVPVSLFFSTRINLCVLPNGDVVASGAFGSAGGGAANGIARWNGTTWSPLGNGVPIEASVLAGLPNGDVVAGFAMGGGATVNFLARWNGASWSGFGGGVDNSVYALAVRANGDLMVGGNFHTVNGSLSPFFATITTTCPAAAVVSGPGCTGSGGPNVLSATTLPWLGSAFRARATGLPPSSFALIATGVTPIALPLSALFPQGLPSCTAWVLADLIDVALPSAGAVETQVVVPNAVSLVGASFRQQVLPFVFDASGNLIELTSTNALTLTLGTF